jgi:hypothetical protein
MGYVEQLEPRRLMASSAPDDRAGDEGDLGFVDHADRAHAQNAITLSNGRLLVGGAFEAKWALRRYRPDGSLDRSFGDDGIVKDFGIFDGRITVLTRGADGGFWVAGRGRFKGESAAGDVIVAKLKPDGRLDTSFRPDDGHRMHPGFVRVSASAASDYRDDEILNIVSRSNLPGTSGDRPAVDATFPRNTIDGRYGATFGGAAGWLPQTPTDLLGSANVPYGVFGGAGADGIAAMTDARGTTVLHYVYADGTLNAGEHLSYIAVPGSYVMWFGPGGAVKMGGAGQADAATMRGTLPPRQETGADGKVYTLGRAAVRFHSNPKLDAMWAGHGVAAACATSGPAAGEFILVLASATLQTNGTFPANVQDVGAGRAGRFRNAIIEHVNEAAAADAAVWLHATPQHRPAEHPTRATSANEAKPDGITVAMEETLALTRVDVAAGAVRPDGGAAQSGGHGVDRLDVALPDGADALAHSDGLLAALPAGGKLTARVTNAARRGDGAAVVRNRSAPVNEVAPTGEVSGRYDFRELGNRIADVTGALAIGRTLGTFAVRVPEPIITTSKLAVGMTREQQRLAPNT